MQDQLHEAKMQIDEKNREIEQRNALINKARLAIENLKVSQVQRGRATDRHNPAGSKQDSGDRIGPREEQLNKC